MPARFVLYTGPFQHLFKQIMGFFVDVVIIFVVIFCSHHLELWEGQRHRCGAASANLAAGGLMPSRF